MSQRRSSRTRGRPAKRPGQISSNPPDGPPACRQRLELSETDMASIIEKVTSAVVAQLGAQTSQAPVTQSVPVQTQATTDSTSSAVSTVQGSVVSVLDQLVGESAMQPEPANLFVASDVPIGLGVPDKIRAKIIANEYIDLGSLITNYNRSGVGYRIGVSEAIDKSSNGLAALTFEPNVKVKTINTIEAWTTAFQVFVSIYTSQHPSEAPALMKYSHTIRNLATKGCNWRYYDENFRYMRQSKPSDFPWNKVHPELWINAQSPSGHRGVQFNVNQSAGSSINRQKSHNIPKGYCYVYHLGKPCSGCSFNHNCPKCGQLHPASRCNFRPQRDKQSQPKFSSRPNANTDKSK